jgi:tetratricopeptide (TPR) repeat protein
MNQVSDIISKLFLIIFGIILGLVMLELILRLSGFFTVIPQEISNFEYDESAIRILALGESTTAGQHNWPQNLEMYLNNGSSYYSFKVYNEGKVNTNTAIILNNLEEYLIIYKPHIVISMMGINDESHIIHNQKRKILFIDNLKIANLFRRIFESDRTKHYNFTKIPGSQSIKNSTLHRIWEISEKLKSSCLTKDNTSRYTAIFKKIIEELPIDDQVYRDLSKCYRHNSQLDLAKQSIFNSIEINPNYSYNYFIYANILCKQHNYKEANIQYKKAISLDSNGHQYLSKTAECLVNQGRSEKDIEKFYTKQGFSVNFKNSNNKSSSTSQNYILMQNILKQKNIKLIAMQYPLRNVDTLKSYFKNSSNIVFVSNQQNFNDSLKTHSYNELFEDRFAGDFGHTTSKGTELITRNVYLYVIEVTKSMNLTI